MTYQTQDLINIFSDEITSTHGDHTEFADITNAELMLPSSLIFLEKPKDLTQTSNTSPAVVVTTESVAIDLKHCYTGFIVCVTNLRLAQAKIKQHFYDYDSSDPEWESIHASAVIHSTAQIGINCRIGPNVVIGANCHIADNVIIRANSVIEHDTIIGEGTIINCLVNVGYASQIGARVTIQAGSIIGSEGYGFAPDNNKHYHRIPHTGFVVLHDDVHIGANTCIDRGTYGSTNIHRGVKFDNLCQVAHNVEIGEDSLLTAQCGVAGSSVIGKRVMMSGQTGILDHKTVVDDVVLVRRAGVTQDITQSGVWAHNPAIPFKEYVRNLSAGKRISKLEKQVKQLIQRLEEQNNKN